MSNLTELRKEIDAVDTQIITLLDNRYKLTDQVAVYKNARNIPLTDEAREQELIQQLRQKTTHPALKEYIEEIYSQIISLNKRARVFNRVSTMPFKRIGIIGLGFIGGSIIKALKAKSQDTYIATINRPSKDLDYGKNNGYIDAVYPSVSELADNVDIIIVASPIDAIPDIVTQILQRSSSSELICIDVASVKQHVADLFASSTTDSIQFIPTHPMAGSEKTGFRNAQAMVFVNKPWAITPHEKTITQSLDRVKEFTTYLGSTVVEVSPEQHDREVAVVSHLVFMISIYVFAYIHKHHPLALQLAGSGFESLTRLASGSVSMHTQIVQHNAEHVEEVLQSFTEYMRQQSIRTEGLYTFFQEIKTARDTYITDRSLDSSNV